MNDFTIEGGVATIHDPSLYNIWFDREDYLEAVSASPDPEIAATKRLLVDFEAELARLVRDKTVDENIVEVMTRFIGDDYVQHDPNATGHGRDNVIEHFRKVPLDRGTPPPVVNVTVEGELASVMMKQPLPDPTSPGKMYDWYILTTFRVRNGKLVEHWSAFQKMAAPLLPEPIS